MNLIIGWSSFFNWKMINSGVEIVLLQNECFSGLGKAFDYTLLENQFNNLCIEMNSDKGFFFGVVGGDGGG